MSNEDRAGKYVDRCDRERGLIENHFGIGYRTRGGHKTCEHAQQANQDEQRSLRKFCKYLNHGSPRRELRCLPETLSYQRLLFKLVSVARASEGPEPKTRQLPLVRLPHVDASE